MRSIGEVLKRARDRRRLTLDDVYQAIKIHPKYLKALEEDDYSVFSGKVHSKGFLKVYANFLNLSEDEVIALWRREYEGEFEKRGENKFLQVKNLEAPKFIITPGFVIVGFFITVLTLFFGYLFYQYHTFTGAPKVEVYHPQNNQVVGEDILDTTGRTDLDSEIFINNQKVVLAPDGSFVATLKLKEGLNTLSIKAVNKLSKQTEIVRTVIYRPVKQFDENLNKKTDESSQSSPSASPPKL